jgi:hypothetical protein
MDLREWFERAGVEDGPADLARVGLLGNERDRADQQGDKKEKCSQGFLYLRISAGGCPAG